MAVTDERDPGVGLVGDGEQGAAHVLVEHARLVDEQEVAGEQPRLRLQRIALDRLAGPVAVLVPTEAVLVGQPGARERGGSELLLGDQRGLQGRGDHHEPLVLHLEQLASGGQDGGLAGAGRALDHQELRGAVQRGNDLALCPVEVAPGDPVADPTAARALLGACRESGDEVGLDVEDVTGGE